MIPIPSISISTSTCFTTTMMYDKLYKHILLVLLQPLVARLGPMIQGIAYSEQAGATSSLSSPLHGEDESGVRPLSDLGPRPLRPS